MDTSLWPTHPLWGRAQPREGLSQLSKAWASKKGFLLPSSKAGLTIMLIPIFQSYFKYLHIFEALLSEEAARTLNVNSAVKCVGFGDLT